MLWSERRRPRGWVTVVVATVAILILVAIYLAVLRMTMDVTRLDAGRTANDRDLVYLIVHGAFLVGAIATGFIVGSWQQRTGLGFGLLFVCVLVVVMVVVQAGSAALACDFDHNDLVRHWQCEVTRTT